jgi:cell division protein FtsQ
MKRNYERKIAKTEVVFLGDDNLFITSETVNKMLIEKNQQPQNLQKEKLDLNKLEKRLDNHNMIEKSEVFVSVDGVLKIVVKQKIPIARIFDLDSSFYFDYQGNKMPISNNYSSRVPLVTGEINAIKRADLTELFRIIQKDDFLKKNIIGVQIYPNGAVIMASRNYDYQIDFGRLINVEQKLKNYKAFYQKAVSDSSIVKYKKINLIYTQQVVCTK